MSDRLHRGDCLAILPTLPERSVQLILTSPPYNVGFDYADGGASDQLPLGSYLGMLRTFLCLAYHVLADGGVLALNLPPTIRTPDHRAYPLGAWAQLEMLSQGYRGGADGPRQEHGGHVGPGRDDPDPRA